MKLTKDLQRSVVENERYYGMNDTIRDSGINVATWAAASGGTGFLIGGTAGIVRGATPVVSAIALAIQYSILGAVFGGTRHAVLRAQRAPEPTPEAFTFASSIAGGVSGAITGMLIRGPRNIVPGALVWAPIGAAGQMLVNAYNRAPEEELDRPKPTVLDRASRSRWSPITSLTDEDYIKKLREKLLKVDVEIAIIDDKIAAIRKEDQASKNTADDS